MGEKKKQRELWTCIYCNYKSDKETLLEQGYMYELKNGVTVCECPRCDSQQQA